MLFNYPLHLEEYGPSLCPCNVGAEESPCSHRRRNLQEATSSSFRNDRAVCRYQSSLDIYEPAKVRLQWDVAATKMDRSWPGIRSGQGSQRVWPYLVNLLRPFLKCALSLTMCVSKRTSKVDRVFFSFSPWILSQKVVKYCFLFLTCFDMRPTIYASRRASKVYLRGVSILICIYIYIQGVVSDRFWWRYGRRLQCLILPDLCKPRCSWFDKFLFVRACFQRFWNLKIVKVVPGSI